MLVVLCVNNGIVDIHTFIHFELVSILEERELNMHSGHPLVEQARITTGSDLTLNMTVTRLDKTPSQHSVKLNRTS